MASEKSNVGSMNPKGSAPGAVASGTGKARHRKVYEHVMTPAEHFALQTVQRAQSALATINDAIKSGKTVKPEVIKLCFQLSQVAGEMLFPTA